MKTTQSGVKTKQKTLFSILNSPFSILYSPFFKVCLIFSTSTIDNLNFDSVDQPAICGVRITFSALARYWKASGQEQEIADALSGISMDETNKELEQMRNVREKMKANAKISKELAGTDTKRAEAEFLEYAKQSVSNKEFENGMFDKMSDLGKDSQQKDPQKDNPAGLPEN